MQSGGFALHVANAFIDFQGLLIEGDRLVYLSLIGIDKCHVMQGVSFDFHISDAFYNY
jgi:hypothetical protein